MGLSTITKFVTLIITEGLNLDTFIIYELNVDHGHT